MFAKLCNWAVMGSLAYVLSACGGGDPDGAVEASPAGLTTAASPAQVNAAFAGAAGSAAASSVASSVVISADPSAYQHAAGGSARQITQASMSLRASAHTISMHGGGAYEIADPARAQLESLPHALKSRDTDPDVADDDARARMAVYQAEIEKTYSLEKNRELAERKAIEGIAEPAVHQAYVPHEDCLDAGLPECAGNPRLARY